MGVTTLYRIEQQFDAPRIGNHRAPKPAGTTNPTTAIPLGTFCPGSKRGAGRVPESAGSPQNADPISLVFEDGDREDEFEDDEYGDEYVSDEGIANESSGEIGTAVPEEPSESEIMTSFGSFTLTMSSERLSRKSGTHLIVIPEDDPVEVASKSERDIQDEILYAITKSPSRKVLLEDFDLLKLIGVGGFGKVFQVRERNSGSIYAMKVYKKEAVVKNNQHKYAHAERDILKEVSDHPFIVTLHYSFQTNHKLYFVMDFLNGGQLFFHLRNEHMFPEAQVRFYIAEITLALEHLHKLDIIHRDLKPENLLLDCDGHVVVTDFGLAKASVKDRESTNSFCGTEEYMAPEMIDRLLYGKAVDWWALGALTFDMLTGNPPFVSRNRMTLYKKIKTEKLKYPKYLTGEAVSFIKGLLTRDPLKRLGGGQKGSEEVKAHPFFKSINWKKLYNKEIPPAFKPPVQNGVMDVSNFDDTYTKQVPHDSPSSFQLSGSQTNLFKGFSYVAPHLMSEVNETDSPTDSPASGPSN